MRKRRAGQSASQHFRSGRRDALWRICLAVVGWLIGDVHSLFWLHGSQGEQWTAAELEDLGGDWSQVHDIVRNYGNWDHIVVGPSGVFLIDTKRLSTPARVERRRTSFWAR
jgi:Nuclease-related domain